MHDARPTFREYAVLALALAIGAAQLYFLSTGGAYPLKDDAYISLQYAKNLVSGNGLVFNPGERVEGFTNPLWTLLCAAVLLAGAPAVPSLTALGGLSFLALIYASWRAARRLAAPEWLRGAAPLITASSGAIAFWALSGMETVAFAWLVVEAVGRFMSAAREGRRVSVSGGFLFGIATLVRPEALAYFFLASAVLYLRNGSGGHATAATRHRDLRQVLLMLAAFSVSVGLWQAFRLGYYHAWLPNTFYAKVDLQDPITIVMRGFSYVSSSLTASPWALLIVFTALAPRFWEKSEVLLPAIPAVFQLLYVIVVGGDYMPFGRFIVPAVPLLALAFTAAQAGQASTGGMAAAGSGGGSKLLVLLLCCFGLVPHVLPFNCRKPDLYTQRYERAGRWLAAHAGPATVVASPAIGAIGYLGNVLVLDTFGLTSPEIARHHDERLSKFQTGPGHGRANIGYVLSRRPDIILVGNVWLRPEPLVPQTMAANMHFVHPTDQLLFSEPDFFNRYQIISFPAYDHEWFGMAVRRDSTCHPSHPRYAWPKTFVPGSQ